MVEVACDSSFARIGEAYSYNLLNFLEYLTYTVDRAKAEEAERKFQEQLAKANRHR